jgi:hypothetical protein
VGHGVVCRIETVGVDLSEIGDRRLGPRIRLAVIDPYRCIIARRIERLESGSFLLAANDAIEFAVGEVAQLIGDRSIRIDDDAGRRCCRGLAWRRG